jgi:gluconate:H+ symporter, GntP family
MFGPLICLLIGVALILVLILYFRVHAFLALILSAFAVALFSDRIAYDQAIVVVSGGFAGLMGNIGILLVLASLIGKALMDSGAAERIVRSFSRLFGARENYAYLASGSVLSITVFFDTVFYLLAPIIRSSYARKKRDYALMVCAAGAGAAVTHALVPPTPGPLAVAQQLNVSLGSAFMIGLLASIVPILVGGIGYARFINSRVDIKPRRVYGSEEGEMEEMAVRSDAELPALALALAPILLPVSLISLASLQQTIPLAGPTGARLLNFFGHKDVALLLGFLISAWLIRRYAVDSWRKVFKSLQPAVAAGAVIAFITCGGGAFGSVLAASGVGEVIADTADGLGVSLLSLAFLTAALLRVSQGSATVAMITTAGIVGPALANQTLPYHPAYLVAVIGFGATTTSWMNDSGFWIVGQMAGLSEGETLKLWTVLLTILAFSGYLWVAVLSWLFPFV